jgi:hypothetical protein
MFYGCGPQTNGTGEGMLKVSALYGAGMCVRKKAWLELRQNGFVPLLVGRKGSSLMSGEDLELCLALRQASWCIYYNPALRLKHFMPRRRLQWGYLQRLAYSGGQTSTLLDPYWMEANPNPPADWKRRNTWGFQMRRTLRGIAYQIRQHGQVLLRRPEGDRRVFQLQYSLGRLAGLIVNWSSYNRNICAIRHAPWIRGERNLGAGPLL